MKIPSCKKIAVARRNRLGDLVCALPLIEHCKVLFPEAEISLFLSPLAAMLAPYLQGIDKVVTFPAKGNRYFHMFKTGFLHSKDNYDLAISAKPSPMRLVNVFLWALRARCRLAVVKKKTFLINGGIEEKTLRGKHQALRVLQILAPDLQEIPEEYYPRFNLQGHSEAIEKALCKLKGFGPIILVSMTNNRTSSQISVKKYITILNDLYKKHTFSVAISCVSKDLLAASELQKALSCTSSVVETGQFNDFMHLVNGVDMLFIGDGGVMHIAAAFDKPQLVLFGHVKIEEWRPLSKKAVSLGAFTDVNEICNQEILRALEGVFRVL
ncbi:MAG: glycosyltransferase family 9 protein [Chlamydiales bacterium]|nr:glycosyltransferase family 9 protein [Chlamydiales bacterium]